MSGFEDWESILYPQSAQILPRMCKTPGGFSLSPFSYSCSFKLTLDGYNWCDREWSNSTLCATGDWGYLHLNAVRVYSPNKSLALRGLTGFHYR